MIARVLVVCHLNRRDTSNGTVPYASKDCVTASRCIHTQSTQCTCQSSVLESHLQQLVDGDVLRVSGSDGGRGRGEDGCL